MTNFQKLIIIILIMFVGISGFYLYRQEQIKKDELSFKEKQQKISDCKYLLSNGDEILKKQAKITNETHALYKVDRNDSSWKYYDEYNKKLLTMLGNLVSQSQDCREFLLRSGY